MNQKNKMDSAYYKKVNRIVKVVTKCTPVCLFLKGIFISAYERCWNLLRLVFKWQDSNLVPMVLSNSHPGNEVGLVLGFKVVPNWN